MAEAQLHRLVDQSRLQRHPDLARQIVPQQQAGRRDGETAGQAEQQRAGAFAAHQLPYQRLQQGGGGHHRALQQRPPPFAVALLMAQQPRRGQQAEQHRQHQHRHRRPQRRAVTELVRQQRHQQQISQQDPRPETVRALQQNAHAQAEREQQQRSPWRVDQRGADPHRQNALAA